MRDTVKAGIALERRTAPRTGALVITLALAALITLLPERYHIVPNWAVYLGLVVMVVPMLVVAVTGRSGGWERIAEFTAVGAALAFNLSNVLLVSYNLVENPSSLQPIPLFYTSIAIWAGNVLIFTLLYWLVDRGGPDARLNRAGRYPDFDFPAMDDDEQNRAGWQPGIIDYLFLGFTTSTAFSPTEAMPKTARAKVLMMLQSTIALITIAVVAARTINILK